MTKLKSKSHHTASASQAVKLVEQPSSFASLRAARFIRTLGIILMFAAIGGVTSSYISAASLPPRLQTASGLCVTVGDLQTLQGVHPTLADCTDDADQLWRTAADNSLRNEGHCLSQPSRDSSIVELQNCDGSVTQQWHYADGGRVMNLSATSCLQPVGGQDTIGASLEAAACDGSTVQRFNHGR